MRTFTILLVLSLTVAVVPRSGSAQRCEGCPGDLDGNGKVTVDEIIAVVNAALGGCEGLFFSERFVGEQLNPARWGTSLNAYPAPGTAVSNGFLQVGQAGATSLDFPYIESLVPLFPVAGALQLDVVMQFTSTGPSGGGLSVLGANDRSLVRIRNQTSEPSGLTITLPGARVSLNHVAPEGTHTYSLTFAGGALNISVDGALVVGNFPVDSQPSRIWLGHPTVGQLFGIDQTDNRPSGIDDAGKVVGRWWTTAEWSSFRVDSITVRPLPSPVN